MTSRRRCAQQTLAIIRDGHFTTAQGSHHDIAQSIRRAVAEAEHVSSEQSDMWLREPRAFARSELRATMFSVRNETTITAARSELQNGDVSGVAILNFASATSPGGAFWLGMIAQEQALAISSALLPTQTKFTEEFYRYNETLGTALYTDNMIYSPDVPFFRDDELNLVDPFPLSVLTSPAVHGGQLHTDEVHRAHDVMTRRIRKILTLFARKRERHLILGAYGCGVFGNSVESVASIFANLLLPGGDFYKVFHTVVFAIYHKNEQLYLEPFRTAFRSVLQ